MVKTKIMLVSNCCGFPAGEFEDIGLCPRCKDHCVFIEDKAYDDELNNPKWRRPSHFDKTLKEYHEYSKTGELPD